MGVPRLRRRPKMPILAAVVLFGLPREALGCLVTTRGARFGEFAEGTAPLDLALSAVQGTGLSPRRRRGELGDCCSMLCWVLLINTRDGFFLELFPILGELAAVCLLELPWRTLRIPVQRYDELYAPLGRQHSLSESHQHREHLQSAARASCRRRDCQEKHRWPRTAGTRRPCLLWQAPSRAAL